MTKKKAKTKTKKQANKKGLPKINDKTGAVRFEIIHLSGVKQYVKAAPEDADEVQRRLELVQGRGGIGTVRRYAKGEEYPIAAWETPTPDEIFKL